MLNYLNFEPLIIREPKDLDCSNKIILPGVGSYDTDLSMP